MALVLGPPIGGGESGVAQRVVTEPPGPGEPIPGDHGAPATTGAGTPAARTVLPATFLAVRDRATELVVVETTSGEDVRTLVDLGDFPENPTEEDYNFHPVIDGLALNDGTVQRRSGGPFTPIPNLKVVSLVAW